MAWTAPRTWNVGDIATASNFNTHIRDNETYLKTQTDNINVVAQASSANTFGNIYQNLSGKFLSVAVTMTVAGDTVNAKVGSGSPPATLVGKALNSITDTLDFFVPNNYYYTISTGGAAVLISWVKWTFH